MRSTEIARYRLHNQLITPASSLPAEEVVAHLGAMQAQDYAHTKWALGIRAPGSTAATIEQLTDQGRLIRIHVLRPTWHLVSPRDVRWMLALSEPQVSTILRTAERNYSLDGEFFRRVFPLLESALAGLRYLTRQELMEELNRAGIPTNSSIAAYIMYRAELSALVCNGPRRGTQFTYALLDERVPPGKTFNRAEAIAELANRYFTSHGPATLADFQWWSGLKKTDARAGLEAAQPRLVSEKVEGLEYWWPAEHQLGSSNSAGFHLLPGFDEFLISYTDRTASLAPERTSEVITKNGIFKPVIVSDGQVKGIWKRTFKKQLVQVEHSLFSPFSPEEKRAFEKAAEKFAAFYERELVIK